MKIIKSDVSILPQEAGIVGLFKHIEKVGRVAYKSEDKITPDSYIKFVDMLYKRGHHAVFNLGTVYMAIPNDKGDIIKKLKATSPWTKWTETPYVTMITTNYRVICQLGFKEVMEEYWTEPTENHYHRVTSHFICSRQIAQEITRHRIFCPVMESTRYCNYGKDKFGSQLTFILPQWAYRVRDRVGHTIDPQTYQPRDYILTYDGEELWNELTVWDRTVASRDNFWKAAEEQYIYETTTDEGESLKAEEAAGSLPLGIKTELFFTGYVEDWMYENPEPEVDPEKAGFFFLRCAKDAHPDVRVLAISLKDQFEKSGITKLK